MPGVMDDGGDLYTHFFDRYKQALKLSLMFVLFAQPYNAFSDVEIPNVKLSKVRRQTKRIKVETQRS